MKRVRANLIMVTRDGNVEYGTEGRRKNPTVLRQAGSGLGEAPGLEVRPADDQSAAGL